MTAILAGAAPAALGAVTASTQDRPTTGIVVKIGGIPWFNAMEAGIKDRAGELGLAIGIAPVNRYGNHLINTGWLARGMIEKLGADNIFSRLHTYHMNIKEMDAAKGILDPRAHLRCTRLSGRGLGTPGEGTCDRDQVCATLAAIGFRGVFATESFPNMPPEAGYGLAVRRPVAENFE